MGLSLEDMDNEGKSKAKEAIAPIRTSDSTIKLKKEFEPKPTAVNILNNGAAAIGDRAAERDTSSERSMNKAVKAFNIMYDKDLTEIEGWQFMVMLKMSRGSQGDFRLDDYEDQASYSALAGECACS